MDVMHIGHIGRWRSCELVMGNGNSDWHMMRAGQIGAGQGKAGQDRSRAGGNRAGRRAGPGKGKAKQGQGRMDFAGQS